MTTVGQSGFFAFLCSLSLMLHLRLNQSTAQGDVFSHVYKRQTNSCRNILNIWVITPKNKAKTQKPQSAPSMLGRSDKMSSQQWFMTKFDHTNSQRQVRTNSIHDKNTQMQNNRKCSLWHRLSLDQSRSHAHNRPDPHYRHNELGRPLIRLLLQLSHLARAHVFGLWYSASWLSNAGAF